MGHDGPHRANNGFVETLPPPPIPEMKYCLVVGDENGRAAPLYLDFEIPGLRQCMNEGAT
jgi:hypothetical protein